MPNFPAYIITVFILTVLATLAIFIFAVSRSELGRRGAYIVLAVLVLWLQMQGLISIHDFYATDTRSVPPRFLLLIIPPVLTIIILFLTGRGRSFIETLPLVPLTWVSIVRIPVELCLYWLCLQGFVPELMTFAGRNFDILCGLSAPFIAYSIWGGLLHKRWLLLWNIVSLLSLINIVINAVLSAPFAFQRFAFDQPNVAVLYFPFTWLPCFIVPVVLFTHLVSIGRLMRS